LIYRLEEVSFHAEDVDAGEVIDAVDTGAVGTGEVILSNAGAVDNRVGIYYS
jgi:hypothetical protein